MQKHYPKEIVAFQHENAHLWDAHRSQQPDAIPQEGGEAKSTTIDLPRATNLSVRSDAIPLSFNTLGKQLSQFKNHFVLSIMEATIPSNSNNLTTKKYDGTTDPNECLDVYITQVRLYTTQDAIL